MYTHTQLTLYSLSDTIQNSLVLSPIIVLCRQIDFDLAIVLPLVLILVLICLLCDIVWPFIGSARPVIVVVFLSTATSGARL